GGTNFFSREVFLNRWNTNTGFPPAEGLYDPAHEHDACGIGFVASIRGEKSHQIIEQGIQVDKDLNALLDDLVALLAANASYKADTAGIMLVRRIVKTFRWRETRVCVPAVQKNLPGKKIRAP